MTKASTTQTGSKQADNKNAIRPFHVNVPEEQLTELRRRIRSNDLAGAGNGGGCNARRAARDDAQDVRISTWGGEIRREFEPQLGEIVALEVLGFQSFRQYGFGFAAQEARHPSTHRHGTDSPHVCGGKGSLYR